MILFAAASGNWKIQFLSETAGKIRSELKSMIDASSAEGWILERDREQRRGRARTLRYVQRLISILTWTLARWISRIVHGPARHANPMRRRSTPFHPVRAYAVEPICKLLSPRHARLSDCNYEIPVFVRQNRWTRRGDSVARVRQPLSRYTALKFRQTFKIHLDSGMQRHGSPTSTSLVRKKRTFSQLSLNIKHSCGLNHDSVCISVGHSSDSKLTWIFARSGFKSIRVDQDGYWTTNLCPVC